jgi:hypothetical protein
MQDDRLKVYIGDTVRSFHNLVRLVAHRDEGTPPGDIQREAIRDLTDKIFTLVNYVVRTS